MPNKGLQPLVHGLWHFKEPVMMRHWLLVGNEEVKRAAGERQAWEEA